MAYPLIILGAGASHDYTDHQFEKSPLTNELVNDVFLDTEISDKYREANDIFSEIRPMVIKQKKSLEECLRAMKDEVEQYPERKIQLISLQFYLRDFFEKISSRCKSVNNYRALINRIKRYNQSKACVVNFNYDTLFEKSFDDIDWNDMNSYVRGPLKLIKLHGSHDWAYVGKSDREKFRFLNITNPYEYLKEYPDHISNLQKNNTHPYHVEQLKRGGMFKFPAIAMPLPEKQNYICPSQHIDSLKRAFNEIDRILIIGWAGKDQRLLDLIKENISKKVFITIVLGKKGSSKPIKEKFQSIRNFSCRQFNGGFTDFVASNDCEKFFKKQPIIY